MMDIDTFAPSFPAGTQSRPTKINSRGEVIGNVVTFGATGALSSRAFLYTDGAMRDLGSLGGLTSGLLAQPAAINSAGDVVGRSFTADRAQHAFLYSNGQMIDLNSAIPTGAGWTLREAVGINDKGQIVGHGLFNGEDHVFILDSAGACQIQDVPPMKQSGSSAPWRGDHYDNRCTDDAVCTGASPKFDCGVNPSGTQCSIGYLGCHLTSAAMLLSYHGVAVTPDELNAWLSQRTPGPIGCASCYVGYTHGDIKPGAIEAYAASRGVSLSYRGEIGAPDLATAICEHGPQIVGINGRHHWLVATGATDGQATAFLVNDPASGANGNRTQVDATQINTVKVYSGPNSPSVNPAALVIRVYSPAELLVSDSLGRRVGTDPRSGESFDEIPNGDYRLFALGDDNGELDAHPRKEIELLEPVAGEYKINVIGTGTGTYDLDVFAIDASGQRSDLAVEGQPTSAGAVDEYAVPYGQDRGTGSLLSVTPDVLAPANNRLINVRANIVLPNGHGGAADVKLQSITCSGCNPHGDILGAAIGTDDRLFRLRAARCGGSERIYQVTYAVTDSEGITSTVTAALAAPTDGERKKH
jgi:probable HAF family extracellular repeat protein